MNNNKLGTLVRELKSISSVEQLNEIFGYERRLQVLAAQAIKRIGPFECLLKGFVLNEVYGVSELDRAMKKVEEPVREAIYQRPEAAADIYRWLLEGANRSTNPMLSHPLMGAPDAGIRPVLRLMTKLDWQFLPVVSCQGRLQIELPHTERQPRLVVTLENYHDFTEGDEAMLPPDAFRGHQPVGNTLGNFAALENGLAIEHVLLPSRSLSEAARPCSE